MSTAIMPQNTMYEFGDNLIKVNKILLQRAVVREQQVPAIKRVLRDSKFLVCLSQYCVCIINVLCFMWVAIDNYSRTFILYCETNITCVKQMHKTFLYK